MQTPAIPSTPQPSNKPALRSGIYIGIALGIIHSVIIILTQLLNQSPQGPVYQPPTQGSTPLNITTAILYLLIPLIWITGFLIIGFLAGKSTGKVSTGTLAGLFAGTFGGMVASIGQIVSTVLSANNNFGQANEGLLLVEGFVIILYTLILTIGGGAGVGSLGGLLGQNFSAVRPQPAPRPYPTAVPVYSYVPGQPMPQPIFPGQPMPHPAFPPQPVFPAQPMPMPQVPSENITPS